MSQESEVPSAQDRAMAALGELAGGLAHDFNNLLGALILNLESLEALVEPGGEAAELVQMCLETALHGTEQTRSLFAFSRRQPQLPARTELGRVIAELLGRQAAR